MTGQRATDAERAFGAATAQITVAPPTTRILQDLTVPLKAPDEVPSSRRRSPKTDRDINRSTHVKPAMRKPRVAKPPVEKPVVRRAPISGVAPSRPSATAIVRLPMHDAQPSKSRAVRRSNRLQKGLVLKPGERWKRRLRLPKVRSP